MSSVDSLENHDQFHLEQLHKLSCQSGSKDILVIDDSTGDLMDIQKIMNLKYADQFHVRYCLDAEKGIEILKENNFFLVLLDFKMPKLNGLEVIETVNKMKQNVPFVVLTGYGDPSMREALTRLGVMLLLDKPITEKKLDMLLTLTHAK
jgi:DNA-binding NtrC family response regulator